MNENTRRIIIEDRERARRMLEKARQQSAMLEDLKEKLDETIKVDLDPDMREFYQLITEYVESVGVDDFSMEEEYFQEADRRYQVLMASGVYHTDREKEPIAEGDPMELVDEEEEESEWPGEENVEMAGVISETYKDKEFEEDEDTFGEASENPLAREIKERMENITFKDKENSDIIPELGSRRKPW